MSAEYRAKQADLVASHIAKQDIVITTALIPGRPAPKLVTRAMVESMKPGSVIVDLAVERGGNCRAGSSPARWWSITASRSSATSTCPDASPPRPPASTRRTSTPSSRRWSNKETKELAVKWDDELVKATCLTRDGAIVHTAFQPTA